LKKREKEDREEKKGEKGKKRTEAHCVSIAMRLKRKGGGG